MQVGANASVSGALFVSGAITASVISASQYIGIPTADRNGLITTGSGATTQAITGSLIISGNLVVSGANINLEVDPPALGSPGTTNVKTLLDSTASAIVTSVDVTRLAAGPTGDLTAVRLQTFSGSSDTTGDRLLSRVTTGVNRSTTLGLSGSTVNTQLTSTWATGSSAFTSQIVASAQSNSAALTMNVGNAASNFAGGTASLSAGRVNIGAVNGVITTTGSLSHLGSIVTSQGVTINAGGITATSASINGELRVNGNSVVSASYTNRGIASVYYSTTDNVTGSYVNNFGQNNDTSVAGLLHVVNISSASMATLIATSATNANTIYFVI